MAGEVGGQLTRTGAILWGYLGEHIWHSQVTVKLEADIKKVMVWLGWTGCYSGCGSELSLYILGLILILSVVSQQPHKITKQKQWHKGLNIGILISSSVLKICEPPVWRYPDFELTVLMHFQRCQVLFTQCSQIPFKQELHSQKHLLGSFSTCIHII